jgi:hypothetical protein
MNDLMAAADICFLPSTHEGVALTLYEAMSRGAVFVGADVGGQSEVATAECAVLLPRLFDVSRGAAAYAVCLSQLLRSPATMARMGSESRRRIAKQFTIDQTMASLEAAFGRARDLHCRQPRPLIPTAIADLTAVRAIEYDRVRRLADELWARGVRRRSPAGGGWRMWVFRQCTWLEPAYSWGVRRGWRWLPVARERIRAALVS